MLSPIHLAPVVACATGSGGMPGQTPFYSHLPGSRQGDFLFISWTYFEQEQSAAWQELMSGLWEALKRDRGVWVRVERAERQVVELEDYLVEAQKALEEQ